MAKQDKIITRVEADPALSIKASIISKCLGVTKAQMFITAMEFYIEHHQEFLPDMMQTPKTSTEKK